MNNEPHCPVHTDHILLEELADGHYGFCQKCLMRYKLCSETKYMDLCIKLHDHKDAHLGRHNSVWNIF